MTHTIQVGDKVKWMRLYRSGLVVYWGVVTRVEVGAETPCAIVQPKSGWPVQRVEYASLLRAEDKAQPQPNAWDLLCQRHDFLTRMPPRYAEPVVVVSAV